MKVAVGILIRPNGQVLYAQRLPGKPYEGWWEFPGGKQEPGESMYQTLVRELQEELGVQVTEAQPWVVRDHVYPHATVELHFFRITAWSGEPKSSEGQPLSWQASGQPTVTPILPAALPVIRWLALPEHITPDSGISPRRQGPELLSVDGFRGIMVDTLQALRHPPNDLDFACINSDLVKDLHDLNKTFLIGEPRIPVYVPEMLLRRAHGASSEGLAKLAWIHGTYK